MRWVYQFFLLFPIKSCSAANHLTWTKFVGIQEMQNLFFDIWDRRQSERLSSLGISARSFGEQFLAATYLKVTPVRLLEWLFLIQLGLSRGPWDHGAAYSSPETILLRSTVFPCLWLSMGKLPFNSSREKVPYQKHQFFKLRTFKLIGPY